jgi:hypothetical protein
MGFEIIVMPRPWGQSPLQSPQQPLMQFPCVTALCPCVTAFESSRPPKRIVLVPVPVLSAAVLVLVIDPAHPTSAFDSATPTIGDRRQVIHGRTIASSSGLVPITSTSTVAPRLSTSTTCDRQNGSDQRVIDYPPSCSTCSSCSFGRRLIGHATPTEDQAVYDVRLGEARVARSRAISAIC